MILFFIEDEKTVYCTNERFSLYIPLKGILNYLPIPCQFIHITMSALNSS